MVGLQRQLEHQPTAVSDRRRGCHSHVLAVAWAAVRVPRHRHPPPPTALVVATRGGGGGGRERWAPAGLRTHTVAEDVAGAGGLKLTAEEVAHFKERGYIVKRRSRPLARRGNSDAY